MDAVKTIKLADGGTFEIFRDDSPESPRNGDIYGYVLKTSSPEDVCPTCGLIDPRDMVEETRRGFYGNNIEENGMLDNIDKKYHEEIKRAY